MKECKSRTKLQKEEVFKQEYALIQGEINLKVRRLLQAAQEPGASSWLAALPIQRLGYVLNKQEFRDAIAIRYGWDICDMPRFCACGKRNTVDHVLTCKKVGMSR